jgi:hypothetical protein
MPKNHVAELAKLTLALAVDMRKEIGRMEKWPQERALENMLSGFKITEAMARSVMGKGSAEDDAIARAVLEAEGYGPDAGKK